MATSYPASLDSFTNPTAVDTLDSPPHDTQHADANDAIEALQAKVGVDSSAVTTSLDYRVGQLETGGGGMTVSSTAPSSPAEGDMWYDDTSGRTYVYYDDGSSQQWVEFGAPPSGIGKILQVVSTLKTDTFSASLASGNTVAVTGLSASLTCSDTANSVLVIAHLGMVSNATGSTACGALVTAGGTDILVGTSTSNRIPVGTAQYGSTAGYLGANTTGLQVIGVYSPASTSAITYAVELYNYGAPTGNYYVNRSHTDSDTSGYPRSASSITLLEVSA
jgi:hypothetical protein